MAEKKTFAGQAAKEISVLGENLHKAAKGFAAVRGEIEAFTAVREKNISLANREIATVERGAAANRKVTESRQGGGGGAPITTSSPSGGGITTDTPPGRGTVISTSGRLANPSRINPAPRIPPLLRGVLELVATGSGGGVPSSGVIASTGGGVGGGVIASTNRGAGGGARAGGGGGGGGGGGSAAEFGKALRSAPPTAGERRIETAINRGFQSLKSGGGGSGAAAADFRSRQEY